ncbi:MAG: 3-oxoacyl-ACP synthase III [Bdellovibrionales bacterium GWA2_49_15]|nr:MAG: 3-oxoacyl-ACP synthase III [Bdellovibrionales bacterium GWA2_49_15]HAZ13291.1 3-oxoacyl-ACP synthase III [Bdellovibrionales bacterium]
MKFNNTVLLDLECVLPPHFISSEELEESIASTYQRLKVSVGRLELFTGIKKRGYWPVGTRPSEIATLAAKKILSRTGLGAIDLLINASVCRDQLEPSTAMNIHGRLGLEQTCMAFDLSNACLGVINAISVAGQMIEAGAIKTALIVSGENSGPLLSETTRQINENPHLTKDQLKGLMANLTIGSAGVAILLTHKDLAPDSAHLIKSSVTLTEGRFAHLCQGDGTPESLSMRTDSEALLVAGSELAAKTFQHFLRETGLERKDLNWALGHQVGVAHEEKIMTLLELKSTDTHRTYPHFGNTGSVALPLTLWDLQQTGRLKHGDRCCLLGIGSGLSCSFLEVIW